jgi:hypothetical protein
MVTYQLAERFADLFDKVLVSRDAIVEPDHLASARTAIGVLPKGMWYCPAVSPLFGGTGAVGNWLAMSPTAFMKSAIVEYQASLQLQIGLGTKS